MDDRERGDREAAIRARVGAGDVDGAAADALRLYGGEVFGFLLALHGGDEGAAGDVFSLFSEQLWRGLRGFNWSSSLRTWAYAVARNASHAERRAAVRRGRRMIPLADCPAVEEVAFQVRTETLSLFRTERRDQLRLVREALPPEDQALLILRVDRDLPWLDLARVFLGEDTSPSPEALARESARLRKRFQLVKKRLFELGAERGLLPRTGE